MASWVINSCLEIVAHRKALFLWLIVEMNEVQQQICPDMLKRKESKTKSYTVRVEKEWDQKKYKKISIFIKKWKISFQSETICFMSLLWHGRWLSETSITQVYSTLGQKLLLLHCPVEIM